MIGQCCRGDASAWDRLFEEHYSAVERFLVQLASDLAAEDAEELCQEVFLAAIQKLRSFRGNSRLQTWLFRIAVNKAADWRARHHAAKRGSGVSPIPIQTAATDDEPCVDPPSSNPGPDAALITAEQCKALYHGLDQLDQSCRELIELRYFGDSSYDEIALTLSLNPKTVSSRLSRCLDRLEVILRSIMSPEDTAQFPV